MKIISFVMSLVVILTSFITPANEIKARNSGSTSKAYFFSDQAKEVMSGVVNNIVNEAKTGTSDSQEVLDILNTLPVYAEGEERPHHAEVKVNSAIFLPLFSKSILQTARLFHFHLQMVAKAPQTAFCRWRAIKKSSPLL